MHFPAMTTLNDLISALDENLAQAELATASATLARPAFAPLEKMRKYVLIRVQSEKLAIPIEGLAEIGPMPAIMPLPNLPRWVHGIINQRGEIISVIDLLQLLVPEAPAGGIKKKLAILHHGKMRVGFGFEQVVATVSKPESECIPTSGTPLVASAPEVFASSLKGDDGQYQILEPHLFLGMERLMHYYQPE